jgi:protocatechuate 3,4-dioxygenase beta subunit
MLLDSPPPRAAVTLPCETTKDIMMSHEKTDLHRRRLLQALALAPFSGLMAAPVWAQETARNFGLISPDVCLVTPESTAGPFYVDPKLIRTDITEGREGAPMDVAIQVVTADCTPVEGARVDLWHCDAVGNYSGFARQGSDSTLDTSGETFLRGTQMTGDRGIANFRTIYPGWYGGRTTHSHYKVFIDERTALTSQIFLPDGLSQYIYENVPPYDSRRSERRTFNRDDFIARRAGEGAYAAVRELGDKYTAALVVGIEGT